MNTNSYNSESYLDIKTVNEDTINKYNYHLTLNKIYKHLEKGNSKVKGPLIDINNDNIKLKLHQKRMVYEMIKRKKLGTD